MITEFVVIARWRRILSKLSLLMLLCGILLTIIFGIVALTFFRSRQITPFAGIGYFSFMWSMFVTLLLQSCACAPFGLSGVPRPRTAKLMARALWAVALLIMLPSYALIAFLMYRFAPGYYSGQQPGPLGSSEFSLGLFFVGSACYFAYLLYSGWFQVMRANPSVTGFPATIKVTWSSRNTGAPHAS